MPLGEEVHEALLVDDQLMLAVVLAALFAIKDGDADTYMLAEPVSGPVGGPFEVPLTEPPHEARPEIVAKAAKITPGITFVLSAVLFDMVVSL
jgi:hypothetical protein